MVELYGSVFFLHLIRAHAGVAVAVAGVVGVAGRFLFEWSKTERRNQRKSAEEYKRQREKWTAKFHGLLSSAAYNLANFALPDPSHEDYKKVHQIKTSDQLRTTSIGGIGNNWLNVLYASPKDGSSISDAGAVSTEAGFGSDADSTEDDS